MKKTNDCKKYIIIFILLAILLISLAFISFFMGSSISAGEAFHALLSGSSSEKTEIILMEIRLPRIIAAIFLGGGLAVSGYLLQTFFSNPIAGPYILGISSGAKLTVSLTLVFLLNQGLVISSAGMIISAFIGSLFSMSAVLLASRKVKDISMLIICGIMIGYICSAITDFVITFANDSNIVNLHNWSLGSLSGISSKELPVIAVLILVCFFISLLLTKPISAYRLGEEYAKSVGTDIKKLRIMLIILSSLLSACVTAFAGPISFVGVAVPHLARKMLKSSKPSLLLPTCFLTGSVFCLLADLIARTVFAPTELSISTITALFGVPIVMWILLDKNSSKREV